MLLNKRYLFHLSNPNKMGLLNDGYILGENYFSNKPRNFIRFLDNPPTLKKNLFNTNLQLSV